MKIAVPYKDGNVFGHFGHTETFKIYASEDGGTVQTQMLSSEGSGHGALAGLLADAGVGVLICGGIGDGARNALASVGIRVYGGVTGDADDAVRTFLAGTLTYNPDARCTHHAHEQGHTCGNRGCGDGDCKHGH